MRPQRRHGYGSGRRAVRARPARARLGRTIPFRPLFHASVVLALGAALVLASKAPQFTVNEVVIKVADADLRASVNRRIDLPPEASTLTVNVARIRREVEKDPRVAMASVTRWLPDRIEVQVVPREPKAAIRDGDEYVLVDAGGVCFARKAAAPEGLDELWGIDAGDGRPGTRIGSAQLGIAFRCIALARSYEPAFARTFDFSDPSNIVMRGRDMKAFLGTAENLDYKMAIVFAAPEAAREKGLAAYTIDVRRADAPVLSR